MQFGPLIKYYRNQKGLTQKELAEGICSISHLSKIENNSKEANDETITLLLKRLQINIEEVNEKEEMIGSLLNNLNEKMNFNQRTQVEEIATKLKEYEGIIPFSSHLYTYELYKFRYYLFIGDAVEAQKQKDLLNKQKKLFSQHESYLFHYFHAVLYMLKRQYSNADKLFDTLFVNSKNDITTGELLYHRALAKSSMEQSGHAIYFGKMALQAFMNEHNFIRILHSLMLLGINYTHSKIYEEALACFQHLIRNAELLGETCLLPQIYHNMGYLQQKMNNHKDALFYYQNSLSLQEANNLHYLVTQYAIGEIFYSLKQFEDAKNSFHESIELAKRIGNKKYQILARYYLIAMKSYDESIEYLVTTVIPYLEERNEDVDALVAFYKLLSKHYQNVGEHEIAIKYLSNIF